MRKNPPQLSSFARRFKIIFSIAIIFTVHSVTFAQLTVTEGTTSQGYTLNATAIAVDPALTVSSSSSINGFRVTISTGLQSGDVLSCPGTVPSGITVTAYNSSTGTLAFTGSTSAANWQTFLRSVDYRCTNTSQVGNRTITFSAGNSSAFTNGHYYELISSPATWTAAKTLSEARSYLGYGGYLATITSAAENNFIRQVLNADAWIGSSDNYTYINAATGATTYANQASAEGKWYWVTGPEKGTQFSNGNNSPTSVSGRYMNWNSGEPNNAGSEHHGEIYSSGSTPGAWNDLANVNLSYVVEYGGLATDPVQTISANITIYMNVTSNSVSSAQTKCNGVAASTLTGSTVAGGTGSYTYAWQSSTTSATSGFSAASGTNTTSNYSPGTPAASTWYRRVVTSGSAADTASAIKITINSAITSSSSTTEVNCFGGSNGAASLSISGGTSPYTYAWSPSGGTGSSASGLSAGNYTATITDNLGCTATKSVTITQPSAALSSSAASQTNVLCNAATTGAATVSVSGGTSPYTYNWSTGSTSISATSLAAGSHTCTITDVNSCTTSRTFTITQPSALSSSASTTNVSCNGGSNGSATVSPAGGTSPFTYLWSTGGTSATKTSLYASTFTCTVTDVNGCTVAQTVTITHPNGFGLGGSTTNVSCNGGSNGSATIIITGGTSPYSYSWPSGGTSATSPASAAGTYTCSVIDANGCTTSRTFTIGQPNAISINASAHHVACNGSSTGSVTMGISGGTTPYSYLWSNGSTNGAATQLAAGTFTLTLTDANGCTALRTYTINQPSAIAANASTTDALCNGSTNGSASVAPSGGTSPFTVTWQGGSTGTSLSAVVAGTYTYNIVDANGCQKSGSAIIGQPSTLATNLSSTDVTCNGGTNGSLSVSQTGGTSPYQYSWNHTTAVTASLSNQSAGTYTCQITDANGCTSTATTTITEPTILSTTTSQADVTCFGGNNGIASITPAGGTAPYSYAWNHSTDNISSFNDLSMGTYQCTITDANGCTTPTLFTIVEPTEISTSTNIVGPLCNGGAGEATVSATGGTGNLAYNWSNGTTTSSDNNLMAGTYTIIITDDNGCSYTTSVTVNQPTAIQSTITTTDPLCNGDAGSAAVSATGGAGAYTYQWITGGTTNTETGIYAGQYSLTTTDDNGCAYTNNFTITEPPAISTTFTTVSPLCHGGTGEITAIVTGGTGNITYIWATGETTATSVNLYAANYPIQLWDANGCYSTAIGTLTEPSAITYNVVVTDEHCNQGNGSVSIIATGGTGILSYTWNNGSTDFEITSQSAGTFDFTMYDENGCTEMNQATINNISAPSVSSITTDVLCNGDQNGIVDLSVTGGTTNYTYLWSNGAMTEDISSLVAGTYDYTVTDDANCVTTGTIAITEPTPLANTFTSTNEITGNDGSIDLTVNGGTPTYTYSWDDGTTTEDRNGLTAGNYSVQIWDAHGCYSSAIIIITSTVGLLNHEGPSQAINILPNPSNGDITIKGLQQGEYAIYDTSGRLVKIFTTNEPQMKIDLNVLSNGLYNLRNISGKEKSMARFIISK